MENDIELKKRDIKIEDKLSFSLLLSLLFLCRDVNKKSFKEMIEKLLEYKNDIVYKGRKIIFDVFFVNYIFEIVVSKIVGYMKLVLV